MSFVQLQAHVVDRLKRDAITRLQRHHRGEVLLLTVYLWGEEATETRLLESAITKASEPWLRAHIGRHLGDEARHARLLRERLKAMGAELPRVARVDPLSARKLAHLKRLIHTHAARFEAGLSLTIFVAAEQMETMAVRVLTRHLAVLDRQHYESTHRLLTEILEDEVRHRSACAAIVDRLVLPTELEALHHLRDEVIRIERSWGITGAALMWLAGVWAAR